MRNIFIAELNASGQEKSVPGPVLGASGEMSTHANFLAELELELIQTQMAQKPMLRAEVGMRVRCANKASAE